MDLTAQVSAVVGTSVLLYYITAPKKRNSDDALELPPWEVHSTIARDRHICSKFKKRGGGGSGGGMNNSMSMEYDESFRRRQQQKQRQQRFLSSSSSTTMSDHSSVGTSSSDHGSVNSYRPE